MVITKDDVSDIVKLLLINNQVFDNQVELVPGQQLQGECYEKLNRIDDALKSYQNAIKYAERKKQLKRRGISSSEEEFKTKHFRGTSELLINSSLSSIATNGIENSPTMDNEVDTVEMRSPTLERQISYSVMSDDAISSAVTVKFTVKHISNLYLYLLAMKKNKAIK